MGSSERINECSTGGCIFSTATGSSAIKRVDLDAIPQVGGQSLLDFDLDVTDKPWKLPGL